MLERIVFTTAMLPDKLERIIKRVCIVAELLSILDRYVLELHCEVRLSELIVVARRTKQGKCASQLKLDYNLKNIVS